MKLRWYVEETSFEKYDGSLGKYVTYNIKSNPVLQYYDALFDMWVTVETYTEYLS